MAEKRDDGTEGAEPERADTQRVILECVRVLVIPDDVEPTKVAEACKVLGLTKVKTAGRGPGLSTVAWLEHGTRVGASKTHAIEAFAGKPGTPDAKTGTFKAPSVTAWKGGAIYKAPPQPLVEREVLL